MNPYKVLGVSENATQDEIRNAYLALVKKYHPDKFTDSAMKELATDKLKQVNEAYDMLTKKRQSSNNSSTSKGGYYSGDYGTYRGDYAQQFARARAFLSQNNVQSARGVLDSIPLHNAEWHYIYGIVYLRLGWYDKANEYITRAYNMEPNNAEYRDSYNAIKNSGSRYGGGGDYYNVRNGSASGGCSTCDICSGLLCADCCCEACGGDIIRCC